MKVIEQPDRLDGYVVIVEEADLDRPLELPEVQGEWVDIINRFEGVVLKGGLFHCVYLTNNEFAIEFMIPDERRLPRELRLRLLDHLI